MIKISLNLHDYQLQALEKAKWDQRKDMSSIIREAVDKHLEIKEPEKKEPKESLV